MEEVQKNTKWNSEGKRCRKTTPITTNIQLSTRSAKQFGGRRNTRFNSRCRRRRRTASWRMTVLRFTTAASQTLRTTGLAVAIWRVAEITVTGRLHLGRTAAVALRRRCTVAVGRRNCGTRVGTLRRRQHTVVVCIGRLWHSLLRTGGTL